MLIKLTLANNEFVKCEIWCFRSSSELGTNRKEIKKILFFNQPNHYCEKILWVLYQKSRYELRTIVS